MPLELENRRVLVLGLGSSGMSMARWLAGRGARVRVADSRAVPPHAEQLRAELPGVDPKDIEVMITGTQAVVRPPIV